MVPCFNIAATYKNNTMSAERKSFMVVRCVLLCAHVMKTPISLCQESSITLLVLVHRVNRQLCFTNRRESYKITDLIFTIFSFG